MCEYINSSVAEEGTSGRKKKKERERCDSGTRVYRLVGVSFGLLCVLQVILNISLRLQANEHHDEPENNTDINLSEIRGFGGRRNRKLNQMLTEYNKLQTSYQWCVNELRAGVSDDLLVQRYSVMLKKQSEMVEHIRKMQDEIIALRRDRDTLFRGKGSHRPFDRNRLLS